MINEDTMGLFEKLSKEELYQLDKCMGLDGDMFGYRLIKDSIVEQHDFPISLDCLAKQRLTSAFLNKIIDDINTYHIKW